MVGMMDPILARLRELWNLWDIRVLVLLSLILQIILFVFGNRRKYMSSMWINIFVWLAYQLADLVATFALGNLSRAKGNHNVEDSNNILAATWASLLLLHLGGPDTITAYSLEDNQLWLRHLFGLCVQATLAIYVILMSWRKNSWFSYLSLPAFVAGIIKYGERVWVLRSASNDKSGGIVPFDNDLVAVIHDGRTTGEDKYVSALVMAKKLVKEFKRYMENYDTGRFPFKLPSNQSSNRVQWKDKFTSDDTYFWDALEVETGLMYDLFYTKASITYTKCGGFTRLISFGCTMSALVGLFLIISRKEKWHNEHYHNNLMIDIIITWVLLIGALALEIYAVMVILSSDWTMLWLIEHKKGEWVIHLRQKFPKFYQKKKWSKKVGQFDLLGFCFKEDKPAKFSCILGLFRFQDKFNGYMDQTCVDVAQASLVSTVKVLDPHLPAFYELIVIFHLATEICYHLKLNDIAQQGVNSSGHDDQIKETCRTLSHYMMYLLLTCPSALPIALSTTELADLIHDLKVFLKDGRNVKEVCEMLINHSIQLQDPLNLQRILLVTQKFVRNFMGWQRLKSLWLGMLCYAAIKGQKNHHLQQLSQGGKIASFGGYAFCHLVDNMGNARNVCIFNNQQVIEWESIADLVKTRMAFWLKQEWKTKDFTINEFIFKLQHVRGK
ncbi:hypothetical protein LOK49_LG15G02154 [Camellia lanceoleosa]|uniref:Uncharacterized protein n=1 Tax=Camellia lanceoleosa TaxID=1840588 RepID=A0ACC0F7S6_9ERIC|nr:hypothetical protein LOK49_LG15G02154 [Camellia lanceoleosa]